MTKKKILFYWLSFLTSYATPFLYFCFKFGLTKQGTKIVIPTIVLGIMLVIKLSQDIPSWVETWQPSILKGLIKGLPKILLFILLMTLGMILQYLIKNAIDIKFYAYYETVLIVFGSHVIGAIFEAYHQLYREQDMINKGFVLGVVNK